MILRYSTAVFFYLWAPLAYSLWGSPCLDARLPLIEQQLETRRVEWERFVESHRQPGQSRGEALLNAPAHSSYPQMFMEAPEASVLFGVKNITTKGIRFVKLSSEYFSIQFRRIEIWNNNSRRTGDFGLALNLFRLRDGSFVLALEKGPLTNMLLKDLSLEMHNAGIIPPQDAQIAPLFMTHSASPEWMPNGRDSSSYVGRLEVSEADLLVVLRKVDDYLANSAFVMQQ